MVKPRASGPGPRAKYIPRVLKYWVLTKNVSARNLTVYFKIAKFSCRKQLTMTPLPLEPDVDDDARSAENNSEQSDENRGEDISPSKDGGVRKKILKEGYGSLKPIAGYKASVNYIGRFLDGTEFDSSSRVGGPFEFVLGHGEFSCSSC